MRGRLCRLVLAAALALAASGASAGPWSQLPEAVGNLQRSPSDPHARQVLASAEASLLAQASAGHLAATAVLEEAYAELVSPLADREARVARLRARAAQELIAYGERVSVLDPMAAGRALALAGRLDAAAAQSRLRALLVPPPTPGAGETWISPLDRRELVWQPPLQFLMGCTGNDPACRADERPAHRVSVPGFWMDRTEVTNEEYRLCVEQGPCSPPRDRVAYDDPARARESVRHVAHAQARRYAAWVGRSLPTEAQWERAARGTAELARFPWVGGRGRERANLQGTFGLDVFATVAPVASFAPTGWGLYDLAGNVWEWCEDAYHGEPTGRPRDGSAWLAGGQGRVLRGGSWRTPIGAARTSARWWQEEDAAADDIGFRCVLDPMQEPTPERLRELAQRAFPVVTEIGRELDAAQLDAADRRYLERRTITWLLLEGNGWEALPRVLHLLAADPRDPVARHLLERVEAELVREAARSEIAILRRAVDRYRGVLARSPALVRRGEQLDRALAVALQAAARERLEAGDVRGADARLRLARELVPSDPGPRHLLGGLVPEAGTRRTWPGDGRDMVWVPGGTFLMGRSRGDVEAASDEEPARTVRVDGFWLDRTEVTNAAYRRCVSAGACTPPARRTRYDDPAFAGHPVVWVNWRQAAAYAGWAGKRLPTEAEWEYAARGGAEWRYPWGDEFEDGRANGFGQRGIDRWMTTSPVGTFPPNRWGLVDLLGNAREWVEDAWHPGYEGAPRDGSARPGTAAAERVLRGGDYLDFAPGLRVSQREHRMPVSASRSTGFRCAADLSEGE